MFAQMMILKPLILVQYGLVKKLKMLTYKT